MFVLLACNWSNQIVGWFSRADLQGVWGGVATEGLGPLLEGTTQEHRHVAQPLPGLSQGHVTRAQFNTLSLSPLLTRVIVQVLFMLILSFYF